MRTPVFGIHAYISPATDVPYRAQWNAWRHICRSFVFARFAPAHHHPQLSRIIYQNVIYVESGFLKFFLWFMEEMHECQAFWASKDLGSDSAFVWTELKVML